MHDRILTSYFAALVGKGLYMGIFSSIKAHPLHPETPSGLELPLSNLGASQRVTSEANDVATTGHLQLGMWLCLAAAGTVVSCTFYLGKKTEKTESTAVGSFTWIFYCLDLPLYGRTLIEGSGLNSCNLAQ